MTADNHDISDYDTFLEKDFSSIGFANDLLLATNSDQNELDFSTSIKRVKFDINNIDLNLDKISSEEHENLIEEIHKSNQSKESLQQLSTPLDHVNISYNRLEKDVIDPYTEATKIQDALKKLHSTSYLLRAVTYFLYLAQQIEELSTPENFDTKINKNSGFLVKLAKYHHQLSVHFNKNQNLKSLKLTRDYDAIAQEKNNDLLRVLKSSVKSINEISIKSKSEQELLNTFHAFALSDKLVLYNTIYEFLNNNVTVSVNLLTRVLNSPRNIEAALDEVSKKASLVNYIGEILEKIDFNEISDNNLDSKIKKSLLNDLLDTLEITNLISVFWRDTAKKFEVKFRETMNRGGPVGKSLASYKEQIRASIVKGVTHSHPSIKKDGIEVRMMLNSVSALDRR